MTPVYYDYRPLGASRDVILRRDPEIVVSGPAGTGKSRGIIEKLNACAEKYDGCRLLMIRKTRASLSTTGVVTYEKHVLPPGNAEVTYQQASYPNKSVIVFGGMDKATKVMSSEYDIIYVQEATELSEAEWEALTTRLRWGKIPYQQIIGDVNPGPPTHWIKQRAARKQLVMFESRHEENPILWDGQQWTPRGLAYLAKLDGLTGVRLKRLRHGIWAAAEGMVYEDVWDANVNMAMPRAIPAEWPRYWVVDFGYTNPFCWQAWAEDPDGRLIRYREIYRTKRLVEDHARQILQVTNGEPKPSAIICDHDAEDRATLERHLGMETRGAWKSVSPGIQAVASRMKRAGDGKPRLMLMRDALVDVDTDLDDAKKPTSTDGELEAYVWDTSSGRKKGEEPKKENDHGCDAMRYLVTYVDQTWKGSPMQLFAEPPPNMQIQQEHEESYGERVSNDRRVTHSTLDYGDFERPSPWRNL